MRIVRFFRFLWCRLFHHWIVPSEPVPGVILWSCDKCGRPHTRFDLRGVQFGDDIETDGWLTYLNALRQDTDREKAK